MILQTCAFFKIQLITHYFENKSHKNLFLDEIDFTHGHSKMELNYHLHHLKMKQLFLNKTTDKSVKYLHKILINNG
jgi:hypothetical protein